MELTDAAAVAWGFQSQKFLLFWLLRTFGFHANLSPDTDLKDLEQGEALSLQNVEGEEFAFILTITSR